MTGGSCAVRSPIGCAIREPLRQLQLLHPQRVSNGLLVKNNVLSGKNARANASLKRWPMAARAIRNKVVHRARDLSFAAKDNSERLQPVALPRAAVRADIRLHAEAGRVDAALAVARTLLDEATGARREEALALAIRLARAGGGGNRWGGRLSVDGRCRLCGFLLGGGRRWARLRVAHLVPGGGAGGGR